MDGIHPGDAILSPDGDLQRVTAIHPLDPTLPAHRDVLVVTLRRM